MVFKLLMIVATTLLTLGIFAWRYRTAPSKEVFCLTPENFSKTFYYVVWKYKTTKKLSKQGRVIVTNNWDVATHYTESMEKELHFFEGSELKIIVHHSCTYSYPNGNDTSLIRKG